MMNASDIRSRHPRLVRHAPAGMLALALVCSACPGDSARRDSAAVPAETASAVDARTCDARGVRLTGDGLGALRVGATLGSVVEACRVVRDTIAEGPEAQPQRELTIVTGTDTVTAIVVDDAIWRVHVSDPDIRTADGLGVGTSIGDFRALEGATVLIGEGVFVTVPSICGLSFRLSEEADLGAIASRPEGSRLAALPPATRVTEVLAVGCPILGS
jgi:hypothetical protein